MVHRSVEGWIHSICNGRSAKANTDAVASRCRWFGRWHLGLVLADPLSPTDIDGVLGELRRALAPGGVLVTGFFNGNELSAFDHSVATAYYWPIDELSARLESKGFTEIERHARPTSAERPTLNRVKRADSPTTSAGEMS